MLKTWQTLRITLKEIAIDVMGYFNESIDTDAAKKMLRDDYAGEQRQLDGRSARSQGTPGRV